MLQLIAFILMILFVFSPFIFTEPTSKIGMFFRFYCGYFVITLPVYFLYKNYVANETIPRGLSGMVFLIAAVAWILPFLSQVTKRKGMPIVETTFGSVAFFILYNLTSSFYLAFGSGLLVMGVMGLSTLRKTPIT